LQGNRNERTGKQNGQNQKPRNYQKPQGKATDRYQTAKPAAAPVKKGFLAKLIGLFKKERNSAEKPELYKKLWLFNLYVSTLTEFETVSYYLELSINIGYNE
jgi:hypothetical protein